MLKIILVIAFITSVFFLGRSFMALVSTKRKNADRRVVKNLSMRVAFSALFILLAVIFLTTGALKPNNPFAPIPAQQATQ